MKEKVSIITSSTSYRMIVSNWSFLERQETEGSCLELSGVSPHSQARRQPEAGFPSTRADAALCMLQTLPNASTLPSSSLPETYYLLLQRPLLNVVTLV